MREYEKRKISETRKKMLACFAYLAFFAFSASLFPQTGSTHEPITTKVMFNKEVIRILQRNCLGCHSPGRIKADIPLTIYEEARPWAKAIKEEVLEKRMMPYQAVKGYGNFRHDYILPQRDVELLVSWIEGGAPRGEEKDYPKQSIDQFIKSADWPLGLPDLILQPETETKVAAEGDNQNRCFVLTTGLKADRRVRAIDFQPGNGSIVHSASFFIDSSAKPNVCSDKAGPEKLGQWVPGQAINQLPDGTAWLLPANSRIILKIHYQTNGEPATDRSRIGLYFAKGSNNKAVRNVIISTGETSATDRNKIKIVHTVNEPAEAVYIRPLLFSSFKTIEATLRSPDGTIEILILARKYRFDWQPAYYFKRPVSLPRGSRVEVIGYPDDSEDNPNLNLAVLCEIGIAESN